MKSVLHPKLNKIPGGGMPLAKPEVHVKDITKLTHIELLDMKEREFKLLSNIRKLDKLPDKGKRVQELYEKLCEELKRRSNIDDAANMFSQLNIATKGRSAMEHLEWNRKPNENSCDSTLDVLDSDDEADMDPLHLIAQRSMHSRHVKVLPPETTLITAVDLQDIKSFSSDSPDCGLAQEITETNATTIAAEVVAIDVADKLHKLKPKMQEIAQKKIPDMNSNNSQSSENISAESANVEQHVQYLIDKVELGREHLQREKFKPYQTTISNVHDPEKEKLRKKCKHWEVTAATPPLIQNSSAKMLNLLDSVELQVNYLAKLKELQEKQAAERLAAKIERFQERKMQLPSADKLKSSALFTKYRTPHLIEGGELYNEEDECCDQPDEEKSSHIVNYMVCE